MSNCENLNNEQEMQKCMKKNSYAYFVTWDHETLANFAHDCYANLLAEQDANKQIRLDFKEAMQMIRILNTKDNKDDDNQK